MKRLAKSTSLTAYKGFGADLRCRGFQYEVGGTYEHTGKLALCESGFHACEQPLDVFAHYPPTSDSRYALVTLEVLAAEKGSDTKRCGARITIVRELTLREMLEAQVEWAMAHKAAQISSGPYSKAASSEPYSTAASSGPYSTAASSGPSSTAASSGPYSKAASSGPSSSAASSGPSSKAECDTNGFGCVAGVDGMVRGNAGSALSLGYMDKAGHNRIAVGYVGEDSIEPGQWYKADPATGRLVAA